MVSFHLDARVFQRVLQHDAVVPEDVLFAGDEVDGRVGREMRRDGDENGGVGGLGAGTFCVCVSIRIQIDIT